MKKFRAIENANLPENKVCHVVVSGEYPLLLNELEALIITPLVTKSCPDIMPQVSYHADMLFSYLGDGRYLLEKSQSDLKTELDKLGFVCADNSFNLSAYYPGDAVLNASLFDKKLVCGKQSEIAFEKYVDELIRVRQGYSKCSICVVDDHSFITDDESVFKTCTDYGFDVLFVRKGSVVLEGFDYGFIGGCCGKIAKDTIAFFGDLSTHVDCKQIESFLAERGVYPLSLAKGNLIDIGSILPITEINT